METLIRHARQVCTAVVGAAVAMSTMAAAAALAAPPPVQTQVHALDGHRVTLDVYPAAGPLRGAAILSHGFTRSPNAATQFTKLPRTWLVTCARMTSDATSGGKLRSTSVFTPGSP